MLRYLSLLIYPPLSHANAQRINIPTFFDKKANISRSASIMKPGLHLHDNTDAETINLPALRYTTQCCSGIRKLGIRLQEDETEQTIKRIEQFRSLFSWRYITILYEFVQTIVFFNGFSCSNKSLILQYFENHLHLWPYTLYFFSAIFNCSMAAVPLNENDAE